jgi:hypothetical protein
MKKVIYSAGFYNLAFALFHIGFWKIFKWEEDLKKMDIINSGVMQTLNVQTIYYLLFVTFVCIAYPAELQNTKLGKTFLLGCSLFWLVRTIQQFIFFPAPNFLVTCISATIFLIGVVLFALPVFKRYLQAAKVQSADNVSDYEVKNCS